MKPKRGFTILELMIALSLFMIGMLSVLQIFPANRRLQEQNALATQAVFLAQEEMEKIRTIPYGSLTVGEYMPRQIMSEAPSESGDTPYGNLVQVVGFDNSSYPFEKEITVKYLDSNRQQSANDLGLKQVDLTIYWKQKALDRQYSLSTYINE